MIKHFIRVFKSDELPMYLALGMTTAAMVAAVVSIVWVLFILFGWKILLLIPALILFTLIGEVMVNYEKYWRQIKEEFKNEN